MATKEPQVTAVADAQSNTQNGASQHFEPLKASTAKGANQDTTQAKLAKGFKSRYQLRKMLFENALKWFVAVVLLLFIFATLKIFEDKGDIHDGSKRWFTVIITALNIALGINFFSALGDLAKILRWRVLAESPHSMRGVDLILSADSLSKLTALALRYYKSGFKKLLKKRNKKAASRDQETSSRSAMSFLGSATKISLWLVLNMVAQAVIALIGLTYEFDAGGLVIPAPMGPTFKPDLSHFYTLLASPQAPQNLASEQLAAHQLGDIGTIFNAIWISGRRDEITYTSSETYYYVPDWNWPNPEQSFVGTEWVYRYFDYDAASFYEYTYAVPTTRTISTTYDNCFRFPVISGAGLRQSNATVTYQYPDGSTNTILVDVVGNATTTFIYPGPYAAQCLNKDPRCSVVMAFQEPYEDYAAHVYSCEISVGNVLDDDDSVHVEDLSDLQAHYAAASSGLSGFGTTESVFVQTNKTTRQQFQRYSFDSWWNLARNASAIYAGSTMAQFAISSLAAMAEFNPKLATYGPSKELSVRLSVEWWALRILLPVIAAAHFVLFSVAVILANPYVVRDDSNLANAQLFAPMLQRAGLGLGGSGSYLTGEEIAELCDRGLGRREVLYGVKPNDDLAEKGLDVEDGADGVATFWLGLAEDLEPKRGLRRKHSDGIML